MTGEEMERAIEFILQRQATLEEHVKQAHERIEQVNNNLGEQIAETNRIIRLQAESQSALNERLTTAITALAGAQAKTEAKVDRLADMFERLVERLAP